jgi:type IV pilus assembly protein PilB
MEVSEAIERHAVAGSSAQEIAATAHGEGMVALREDGWQKVCAGQTSLPELLRVVV